MEDQVLYADSMKEVISDENPLQKLLKKEQRLATNLQEEQEAEVRAQDRFQRAKAGLQRRRKRLERIQRKLSHVREQLAELQITDQFTVYRENELVTEYPTPDLSPQDQENTSTHIDVSDVLAIDGDEKMANEQEFSLPLQETTSPEPFSYEPIEAIAESELEITTEERSDVEHFAQQENTSSVSLTFMPFESIPESEIFSSSQVEDGTSNTPTLEHEVAQESEVSSPPSTESSIPSTQEQEPVATVDSIAVEAEAEIMDSSDSSSETNAERKPTKPLQLEQKGLSAASSHSSDLQSAKEAWIAAESAMQNIRNAANGLATSISFLSQTNGLSNEFMEELVRKQADANRELLKAQATARAAYERFVQVQRDSQSAASQSMNTSDGSSQQNQEDASLPPAEENGLDQTAKLHAVHLCTEW